MKKLITEREIIEFAKSGSKHFVYEKGAILTPLALDKIKSFNLTIESSQVDEDKISRSGKNFFKAAIGSDHTGYKVKLVLIKQLKDLGIEVTDVGVYNENSADYPDIAEAVALKVKNNDVDFGVLIDATGIPSAITANKFAGIRAATCYNEFSAKSAREHNNANIVVVGAQTLGEGAIKSIIEIFVKSKFLGDRHQRRLDKITAIENRKK